MGDTSWAVDHSAGGGSELTDRTNVITGKLKQIYRKSVLPVEKRYKYDYFYESPLMTDVEFDGKKGLLASIGCFGVVSVGRSRYCSASWSQATN